jgi:peroxiredoxin
MTAFVLIARLLLAGVFAIAGVAKLAGRSGSRQAVIGFGLPSSFAGPLSILLPLVELAVAAALIPTSTAVWGAIGALVLLLLFLVAIGVNLARGRTPDCHCFGQLHSAPAGWKTLARNGILAAVAGFVVWQGWNGNVGSSAIAWLGALSAAQLLILAGGVVVLGLLGGQWLLLIHLLSQNGRLLMRIEALENNLRGGSVAASANGSLARQAAGGLAVGSPAPGFSLKDLQGEELTLDSLRSSGNPVMLLFTDPNCSPCNALLPEIGRWQAEHQDKVAIVLVSRAGPEENETRALEHGLTNVLLQEDREIYEAYAVAGTPGAVLISPDGTIASPAAGGAESIRALVAQAVATPAGLPLVPQPPAPAPAQGQPCPDCGKVHAAASTVPAAVEIGEPAPEAKLRDLEGNTVGLEDFKGQKNLVLFWNPACGFCQQMLPDLKEWEENPPEGAPRLLVVSAGTAEANRQMGLTSTVVLDQQFSVGWSFGASGTPSAVLVDAEGKVASEVAVGAPGVLELAGPTGRRRKSPKGATLSKGGS